MRARDSTAGPLTIDQRRRSACTRAETECKRATELRLKAGDMRQASARQKQLVMTTLETRPVTARLQSDEWLNRCRRAARLLGRDPIIEDAKLLLARRYGCSMTEAFDLLVHVSQTNHRKVSSVAADLVHP